MKKKMIIKGEVVEMSFEEVLELFTPIIYKEIISHKTRIDRVEEEKDDMFQEASIRLWYAFNNYDIDTNYHFSTFAMRYIQGGVQNLTIKNNAQKRDGVNVSLDQSFDDSEDSSTLNDLLSDDSDLSSPMVAREILSETMEKLTDLEVEYLLRMLSGYNASEVAREKDVTRQTAKEKFDKIKRIVKEVSIKYGYLN